jgi:hypothetical protein
MRHLARKAIPMVGEVPAGSLAEALAAVPDRRQPLGWRRGRAPLPRVAVLQVSVAAWLCGAQSLAAMAQWSRERLEDAPEVLVALGLPPGRTPSVATRHRLYKALDVVAFERALGHWLRQTGVPPREALAVDGQTLRGAATAGGPGVPGAHRVAVDAHEAQQMVAQVASAGKGHELAAACAAAGPRARGRTSRERRCLGDAAGGVPAGGGSQRGLSAAGQRASAGAGRGWPGGLVPCGRRPSRMGRGHRRCPCGIAGNEPSAAACGSTWCSGSLRRGTAGRRCDSCGRSRIHR